MNKYIEEFREMPYKFQGNYPKHGKVFLYEGVSYEKTKRMFNYTN